MTEHCEIKIKNNEHSSKNMEKGDIAIFLRMIIIIKRWSQA